jgi:ferredoxin
LADALRSLRDGAALRLDEGACLPLRSKAGQCSACADVCPAGVLRAEVAAIGLDEGCLNCGRCAAACPTEALSLEGYGIAATARAGTGPLRIECWKVMRSRSGTEAVRVPCLGGLSTGRVLELWRAAGEAGLELVDRGWCGACSAGGGDRHPAQGSLDAARLWLEALGVEPERLPRLVSRPLPAREMPESIPAPETERPVSRRQFLHALAAAPVPVGAPGAPAFPASARRESGERRRVLDALGAIAAERGTPLPEELFARVTNNGACADHRICTAICPTGALAVRALDGQTALEFDAETCIACGACERACPEHALSLQAHGGARERRIVAMHRARRCAACGEQYAAKDEDQGLCASCRKTRRFLRSGAALWRAARQ